MDEVLIDTTLVKGGLERIGKYTIINAKKLVNLEELRIEGSVPENLHEIPALRSLTIVFRNESGTLDTSMMEKLTYLSICGKEKHIITGFASGITCMKILGATIRCDLPPKVTDLLLYRVLFSKLRIDNDMDMISVVGPYDPESVIEVKGRIKRIHLMLTRFDIIELGSAIGIGEIRLVRCNLPEVFNLSAFVDLKKIFIFECYGLKKVCKIPASLEYIHVTNYEPSAVEIDSDNNIKGMVADDEVVITGESLLKCGVERERVRDPWDFWPDDYGIHGVEAD